MESEMVCAVSYAGFRTAFNLGNLMGNPALFWLSLVGKIL